MISTDTDSGAGPLCRLSEIPRAFIKSSSAPGTKTMPKKEKKSKANKEDAKEEPVEV